MIGDSPVAVHAASAGKTAAPRLCVAGSLIEAVVLVCSAKLTYR